MFSFSSQFNNKYNLYSYEEFKFFKQNLSSVINEAFNLSITRDESLSEVYFCIRSPLIINAFQVIGIFSFLFLFDYVPFANRHILKRKERPNTSDKILLKEIIGSLIKI